jgi:CheY-like chemotaxis protein
MTLQDKKLWNEQKIKAIGTMAGGIADDFITWLDIISTHATAITDNVIPRTRAYEEATSIIDTTKQAKGMTRRLLSVSKLATNHTSQPPDNVSLSTIIQSAIAQSKLIFNNDKIEFIPRYTHSETSILANEAILTDCIINIFRNAVDAMPDGGKVTIDITKSRNSSYTNHIVLRIRDTGIGMNKDTLSRSCEPFFSTKEKTIGMGLGLTIVKTFTQNYGGGIKIQSKEGIGTSVRLFLPLNSETSDFKNKNKTNYTSTILVVDNNSEILNEIKTTLENIGNTTYTANNADDALIIYQNNRRKIDIIIIDMIMPKKDGKYLFDNIIKLNPKASIIITSGFPRSYIRDRIKTSGWHFIQKPIHKEHLISTIERILR